MVSQVETRPSTTRRVRKDTSIKLYKARLGAAAGSNQELEDG